MYKNKKHLIGKKNKLEKEEEFLKKIFQKNTFIWYTFEIFFVIMYIGYKECDTDGISI